jgi:hypothetical protein
MPRKDLEARRAYVREREARLRLEDPEYVRKRQDKANDVARKKWAEDEAYREKQKADHKKWYDEHGKKESRERKGYKSWDVYKAEVEEKRRQANEYMKAWGQTEKGQRARTSRSILKRCGLTIEEYDHVYDKQEGRCVICKTHCPRYGKGRLVVDHCHTSGAFRALLCGPCNSAIGLLGENVETLRNAISYLAQFVGA